VVESAVAWGAVAGGAVAEAAVAGGAVVEPAVAWGIVAGSTVAETTVAGGTAVFESGVATAVVGAAAAAKATPSAESTPVAGAATVLFEAGTVTETARRSVRTPPGGWKPATCGPLPSNGWDVRSEVRVVSFAKCSCAACPSVTRDSRTIVPSVRPSNIANTIHRHKFLSRAPLLTRVARLVVVLPTRKPPAPTFSTTAAAACSAAAAAPPPNLAFIAATCIAGKRWLTLRNHGAHSGKGTAVGLVWLGSHIQNRKWRCLLVEVGGV
jgi:hypothetical protein